ncbi:SusC/RagA family TonB-linked outer membrane protein [uncultured Dysgonomonas sp.]|uniref:SusC/RagA family TonB-linked outer membrane protein n=2 Tax=uncultured Dysgonomonas sp. TaxID=206096 RepID=A0A212JWF6_9BACT|nr:SusC/RagA family TonB-linked outer membrane protein [uncultured Dysgonomonas sp.]
MKPISFGKVKRRIFSSKIFITMKICFLLLFCFAVQAFSSNSYSQTTNLTLNMENVSVEEVLNQIERQTEFRFLYNKNLVDVNRKVSVSLNRKNITEVLSQLFRNSNTSYTIKDRQIVLSHSDTVNDFPQQDVIPVTGIIHDQDGMPLPGVSIVLKGTTNGTMSDPDGRFSINAPANSTLLITYVGFVPQEIKVNNKKEINIVLNEDTKLLEEVVVVGYGTVLRKNLTTSISSVKTDDISKAANSNMSQLLLGRAAGLQATIASPQPGGNVNLSIRGAGDPIYIVDGVMMPAGSLEVGAGKTGLPSSVNRAGLAGLNPSDIESVEILKDASASIYGIGASNGVVLITTKKGKEGKPRIVYEGNFSVVKNRSYLNVLDAQEYMNLANVFNKENYLYNKNMYPYGENTFDNNWTPVFTPQQIQAAQTTDWKDYVLKTGSIWNQNITINGGTDALRYYLGGNYYKYDGSVANAGMERYALRTNISSQLLPFLKLTAIVNVNQNNYTNSSVGADSGNQGDHGSGALQAALSYPSNMPLKDENGKYSIYQNIPNPQAMLDINDRTKTNGFYTNFAIDVDVIKNMLAVKLLYGINKENADRSTYIPSDLYFGQMYKSRGHLGYSKRQNETLEATLSFQKQFGELMRVDAVVGMGKYLENFSGMDISYENANDQINNDNIGAADGPFYPSSFRGKNEKRSQFARASVDLLDRYVLAGTLRRDGTDKFFPDKKYSYFPSVSLAWKLSNESFMKGLSFVNLLKIRGSYGQTGSDNLGTALYGLFSPSENHIKFGGNSITYIPYLMIGADYPDVSWEKTKMKNIGLDFSLFRDRVWGSFDIFRNDVTRLLGEAPTAPLGMLGVRPINGGHYKRVGWDASVNTNNMQTPQFKWTSLITLSKYNILWVERMPNYDYQVYQKRKNEPMNAYYYYNVTGIINMDRSNMPESQKTLPLDAQKPGYPIIEDRNGDGRITTEDIHMENAVPDIYVGFGNTFTYKDFDLDIFMYGQFGLKKYNYAYAWALPGELSKLNPPNSNEYAYTIWNSQTNPNGARAGIASMKTVSLPGNAQTNTDIQNASFLRVRNITFGYNLNGRKLGDLGKYVTNIRLFADVQNPFLFTNYDGFDPEINTGGGSSKAKAEYPQTVTYSFGAKITF